MGKLTAIGVKSAKAEVKTVKLSDGEGLYLEVKPNGRKYWRYNYRFHKKQKTLALGVYPEVTLAIARQLHFEARQKLAEGFDPSLLKKQKKNEDQFKADNSFKSVADRWCEHHLVDKSKSYRDRSLRILKNDLYPALGSVPITDITSPELLKVLRKVESRTVDIAHRAKQLCGSIFRFAIQEGVAVYDPTFPLQGALKSRRIKHYAAITDVQDLSKLLISIDGYEGSLPVKVSLQIAPIVFQRPGELRNMVWSDINWDKSRWEIPASKMKMDNDHIVPLPSQVVRLLREMQMYSGDGDYVFPSARGRSRPLSDNGMRTALRNMGYSNDDVTPHGFRATARTLLDEVLGFRPDYIEHQLAHAVKDPLGRAYNRTSFLEQRAEMMQVWADFLDMIKANPDFGSEDLLPFKQI